MFKVDLLVASSTVNKKSLDSKWFLKIWSSEASMYVDWVSREIGFAVREDSCFWMSRWWVAATPPGRCRCKYTNTQQGNTLYLQIQIQRLISLILIIPVFEWAPDPLLLHLQVLVRFPHWHMLGNQTTRSLQVQIHGEENTLYLQIQRLISSRLIISVFNGSLMSPMTDNDWTSR